MHKIERHGLDALKQIEWQTDDEGKTWCFCCGSLQGVGHDKNCLLRQLIEKIEYYDEFEQEEIEDFIGEIGVEVDDDAEGEG